VAGVLGTAHTLDRARLDAARDHALTQVMELMIAEVALAEYPELEAVLGEEVAGWRGSEDGLLRDVARAQYLASTPGGAAVSASSATASLSLVLQPGGRIVSGLVAKADGTADRPPVLRLLNEADADRTVSLMVNGTPMFDMDNVVMQILSMPLVRRGEPLYERAWRFVVHWTRHIEPVTEGRLQHQADFYLRSVGSGFCDDVASVLHAIWTRLGYESRVWGLWGHIVPEVRVNGRWELYDPDHGLYYFDRGGRVAGVEQLAADPALIVDPVNPMLPRSHVGYSQLIADIYASTDDNAVEPWYMASPLDPFGHLFTVPAGGWIEIVGAPSEGVRSSADPSVTVPLAPVRMWFPPGYVGQVELPLLLVNVQGEGGRVHMLGQSLDVGAGGLASVLLGHYASYPDVGAARLRVENAGPHGLTLTMAANPLYFRHGGGMTLRALADDLSGLSFGMPQAQ